MGYCFVKRCAGGGSGGGSNIETEETSVTITTNTKTILEAAEGKAYSKVEITTAIAGGVSVATGSLTIIGGRGNEFDIAYSMYNTDGSITATHEYIDGTGAGDVVFSGILLGTPIVLYTPRGEYLDDGDIQGITEVPFTKSTNCAVYKLTASSATASFL